MSTTVYTDGACLGNPGPGGWAWAVPGGRFEAGADADTTNQRMEITAALRAVHALQGDLLVVSDSTYVVNCFRDRWWEGWLARGWMNASKKPVANRDLWEPLIDAYTSRRGQITFEWVKGHADDPTNDLVDRLAVEAARTQQPRSGTGIPSDLGAGDDPSSSERTRAARDPRLPSGRLILVTGHRPPELGGWDDNPVARAVEDRLTEILTAKSAMYDDVCVLTGLDLGAEQLGAAAAARAGVRYAAVLPYPEPDSVWPDASKRRFRALLDGAASQVLMQKPKPESRQQVAGAFGRRNGFLAKNADEAIVVWDGADERIGRLVRTLQDHLGDDVWIVEPADAAS